MEQKIVTIRQANAALTFYNANKINWPDMKRLLEMIIEICLKEHKQTYLLDAKVADRIIGAANVQKDAQKHNLYGRNNQRNSDYQKLKHLIQR